ncbi:MAG: hypothetical protein DMG06_28920 [Acidobacteria bacterium]|nr:MAG: hypothetical protein DMG06_28920 [Acidobacteriota bacterium]
MLSLLVSSPSPRQESDFLHWDGRSEPEIPTLEADVFCPAQERIFGRAALPAAPTRTKIIPVHARGAVKKSDIDKD